MSDFNPAPKELFFSRQDNNDPRLGDIIKASESLENNFIISGYPDDEGIKLNGGRIGSSHAPNTIRKYLYKMTPHLARSQELCAHDIGNLKIEETLEVRHQKLKNNIFSALKLGSKWIGLGGGHDYGFPDGAAFIDYCHYKKQKPLIINFDAHLDVRSSADGINSGTPFYRLYEYDSDIDLLQIGIQSHCNSKYHYEWCIKNGADILTYDEILFAGESPVITMNRFLENYWIRNRPAYISLDIDCFSNSYAPGCSQSWGTGILPEHFFVLLEQIINRLDVRILGIYEVSPPLDNDDRTSKLAAQIVHRFLYTQNIT